MSAHNPFKSSDKPLDTASIIKAQIAAAFNTDSAPSRQQDMGRNAATIPPSAERIAAMKDNQK